MRHSLHTQGEIMRRMLQQAARLIAVEYPNVDIDRVTELLEAAFFSDTNVGFFLADWCRVSYTGAGESAQRLYNAYVQWCELNDEHAMGKPMFGAILLEMGLERRRTYQVFYHGVVLAKKIKE